MQIRKATIDDARKISYLIRKNADKVIENNYTVEQLEAWKRQQTVSNIRSNIMNKTIFCAFQNGKLVGTIGLNKDWLVGMYINYNKRHRGLGNKLLVFIENYASQNAIKKLYLIATPNGFGFYLKNGYKPLEEVNSYYNGIRFIETKMAKEIIK